jgi:hypothetical protein
MIRLLCGLLGMSDPGEDEILRMMPRHRENPELGLVMEDLSGDIYLSDGSVNWKNYGAHMPVVFNTLESLLERNKLDDRYYLESGNIPDEELIALLAESSDCIGAVIWVAAYVDGRKPTRNERGQVEGEHVQYVSPVLDGSGRMLVYDVWPWKEQPFHLFHPFNRDLFNYAVLLIYGKND